MGSARGRRGTERRHRLLMNAALDLLLSRQSVGARHLVEPGPDDDALRTMSEAALRAPDHGALVSFRFAVVRGATRRRLAALFEQAARAARKSEADARVDAERAQRAPVTVAMLAP